MKVSSTRVCIWRQRNDSYTTGIPSTMFSFTALLFRTLPFHLARSRKHPRSRNKALKLRVSLTCWSSATRLATDKSTPPLPPPALKLAWAMGTLKMSVKLRALRSPSMVPPRVSSTMAAGNASPTDCGPLTWCVCMYVSY